MGKLEIHQNFVYMNDKKKDEKLKALQMKTKVQEEGHTDSMSVYSFEKCMY